ncbi:integral membrane sensor signal transduction histidine kinase [Sulfuricella sp. T08]|uniref:sensor histidine kinase n=1 Tax=Sulfuricella sp. T08 TaxID=1632857 RepID=UPI0006179AF5|nr:HAMP domain-containing sensor histidine kinase [Sulfuricella sp. T08]GAO36501.1 integral membrane sensor signal transduction histidine kinase [Sulfuricella sp. T08]
MKFILDLSYRYKIPLWGGLLVIITALAVSSSFILNAYDELKEDLLLDSQTMGYSLKTDLFPAMLHNDVWRAYEIISVPINRKTEGSNPVKAEHILVVDNELRVFVAAHPKSAPMLTEMRHISPEHAVLADRITQMGGSSSQEIDLPGSKYYYYVTPISSEKLHLGTLIIAHPKNIFLPRFVQIERHGLLTGAMILTILLPFNWYWGRRMALPLVLLSERMGDISRKWPSDLNPELYVYRDEIGKLFEAYSQMLKDLKDKEELEKKMVQSERLAALGQLAAGIAHEINNPLSGMLMAIDTLKSYSDLDPRTMKTIALIVRGLTQIKDTVGALLVEAKINSRNLTPQDIEDVLILITPMARKKALHIGWHNSLDENVPLPATLVRQILINLLLNAVQAAEQQGEVAFDIAVADKQLQFSVTNNGKLLSEEQIAHLFEPFSPLSEGGHGLGLWVTYQIVHQLGGHISVKRESNTQMIFTVGIPIGGVA